MPTVTYRRDAAAAYAERWALGRNPAYYDFDALGGDCTNFISQCLYAGSGVMNYAPQTGWYYENLNRRAPAWTGVKELYRFLTTNRGPGPRAREASRREIQPGDVIQLGDGAGDVAAVAFTGQMAGSMGVDERDKICSSTAPTNTSTTPAPITVISAFMKITSPKV